MSSYTDMTRVALVQCAYSEQAVWRTPDNGREWLRPFVTDGPLDAPSWMPSGSTGRANVRREGCEDV